ncbi:MAG: DMT family transporter, partial [Anaerolineales bacterium]|nr:DMT family transporter [Anaerolineales bacterium]
MSVTKTNRSHLTAVAQALFVTFLWSTSWVLIKFGLRSDLPPVTFAGLRYTLAFLCLLPVVLFNTENRKTIRELPKAQWGELILLGLLYYTLAQGSQFVGLALLPAPTLTLLLNFSPIFIAVYSMYSIHERTSLLVFMKPGTFPNKHDLRIRRTFARHRLFARLMQGAFCTSGYFMGDLFQRFSGRHSISLQ